MSQAASHISASSTKTASARAFGATFWVIAIVSVLAVGIGALRGAWQEQRMAAEVEAVTPVRTLFEKVLIGAPATALEQTRARIPDLLDGIYAPIYAAVPGYADFHYSVLGEYIELSQAVLGSVGENIRERLFGDVDARLRDAVDTLHQDFAQAYLTAVDAGVAREEAAFGEAGLLGSVQAQARSAAVARVSKSAPTAASVALGARMASRTAAKAIARKMGARMATKAAAKGLTRGGTALAAAGTGAGLCAWAGPAAVACGVAGGAIAWFAVDGAAVRIDETFTRSDFEDELRQLITEDRQQAHAALESHLETMATAFQAHAAEDADAFTLQSLSRSSRSALCHRTERIAMAYEAADADRQGRNDDALRRIRSEMAPLQKQALLSDWLRTAQDSLEANFYRGRLRQLTVSATPPDGLAVVGKWQTTLRLDEVDLELPPAALESGEDGFTATASNLDHELRLNAVRNVRVDVDQKRLMHKGARFSGHLALGHGALARRAQAEGGTAQLRLDVPMAPVREDRERVPAFTATVTATVVMNTLPPLAPAPGCP